MPGLDPEQPVIEGGKWIWPGPEGNMKKAVIGNFATDLYIVKQQKETKTSTSMMFPVSNFVGVFSNAIVALLVGSL